MASITENLRLWDKEYTWDVNGEEWSAPWGDSKKQWDQLIYPKIKKYLPVETILEIAPGRGRWTKFLENHCQKYMGVDLAPSCIDFCKKRFKQEEKFQFYANDGLSLSMIPDNSCDFIFSFDSLVHAEIDVFNSYLPQIYKKLRGNGVAFLHYSNAEGKSNPHYRAKSTSAASVIACAQKAGLQCCYQETISWRGCEDLDSLAIFYREGESCQK